MSIIECYINGDFYKYKIEPGWSTLYFIREILQLTGTKESCSEGDCGACTVVVGKWNDGRFDYQSVNSCIFPAAKLHGCHLLTIEGIAPENNIHPIQRFLLEHHGAQCGYCTPGIVLSLFSLFSKGYDLCREDIYKFLEGNLCRCTGYLSILEAGESLISFYQQNPENYQNFLPDYCLSVEASLKYFQYNEDLSFISTRAVETDDTVSYMVPSTRHSLFSLLKKFPDAKIINGGTDLWVDINIRRIIPQHIIDISNISGLPLIEETDQDIIIGACVTYQMLYDSPLIGKHIPEIQKVISRIASQQIRHTASITGNIANASPVADMATVLLGLGASIVIMNEENENEIALKDFYLDYKKTVLNQGDIIKQIIIPKAKRFCNFEKSTKRIAVDISAVVSFINVTFQENQVKELLLSFGGVAAYPKLAFSCSADLEHYLETGDSTELIEKITSQFTPISDVRGSKDYRALLIKNHLISHLNNLSAFLGGTHE